MQVDTLREQIERAFANIPIPVDPSAMRLPRYTGDDSYEMAAALAGKHWRDVPIEQLFFHRESLATLNAVAYRAYVPAYLIAALASEHPLDRHGPDLRHYLVGTLLPSDERRDRLALLDAAQRAVIVDVLRYLADHWRMADAATAASSL